MMKGTTAILAAFAMLSGEATAESQNPKFLNQISHGRELGDLNWSTMTHAEKFDLWNLAFKRSDGYYSEDAKKHAFENFKFNEELIASHNADTSSSYKLGHNEYSDLSREEFVQRMGLKQRMLRKPKSNLDATRKITSEVLDSTPESIDWVSKGAVTDIKNQGQCGSCWAFSTTGAIEGAYAVSSGSLVSLSEQNLVSCDTTDNGCSGGLMDNAFDYVKSNGGLCTESDYPYTSSGGTAASCSSGCTAKVTISGYTDVPANDEDALKVAVSQQPVSVAIEADTSAFQLYESGVFTNSGCGTSLDHGVLVVGYGAESGTNYWKVKNSWGSTWGESGFIRLERDVNMCGVSQMASYPTGAKAVSASAANDDGLTLFAEAVKLLADARAFFSSKN